MTLDYLWASSPCPAPLREFKCQLLLWRGQDWATPGTEDKTHPPTPGSEVKGHFQINDCAGQQFLLG